MTSTKKHILVVDDEELVCSLLKDFLEDCGYRVTASGKGAEALDIIKKNDVDLAIVDMRLPDMDGKSFIIDAYNENTHAKYFIHTGSLDYSVDQDLRAIGFTDSSIIYKPVKDLMWLSEKIKKALN